MRYCEANLNISLKNDTYVKNIVQVLSSGINECLLNNKYLSSMHKRNEFKPYSFSFPDEKIENNIYEKNISYNIRFRVIEDMFCDIINCLEERPNNFFVLNEVTSIRFIDQDNIIINNLVSLSPSVVTQSNGKQITLDNMDLNFVKRAIEINTIKKYNQFNDENTSLDTSFIEDIKVINKNRISYSYKNGFILGNKYIIKIKKDKLSQKLAFTQLYSGMGEKNALGLGFCYMKR